MPFRATTMVLLFVAGVAFAQTSRMRQVTPPPAPPQSRAPPRLPPSAPAPRAPFRVADSCPFEGGCAFGRWLACERLPVRRSPDAASSLAFHLRPGQHFQAVRAQMVVTRLGEATIEHPYDHARFGGASFPVGTRVVLLDYLGEGAYRVWAAGRYWAVEEFWQLGPSPRAPGRKLRAPRMTWWVQVDDGTGRRGWLGLRNTVEDWLDGMAFDEAVLMHASTSIGGANRECASLLRDRRAAGRASD